MDRRQQLENIIIGTLLESTEWHNYYDDVKSLRLEARQKLIALRPANIGQASRIPGVNPADIALLADLMGHESIETTRIYLRRTATEQRQIVDRIVTW